MKAALATAAVLTALVIPGTASAHTNGTCTFKANSMAVGIGLSGADVGGGFCQVFRRSLGSGFRSGRATFAFISGTPGNRRKTARSARYA